VVIIFQAVANTVIPCKARISMLVFLQCVFAVDLWSHVGKKEVVFTHLRGQARFCGLISELMHFEEEFVRNLQDTVKYLHVGRKSFRA
jgi:hypothetical protein